MLSLFLALAPAEAIPPAPKLLARFQADIPNQRELCYPSGLRAHLIQRPGSGLTALSMVIDGGQSAETPEERSAAHLVEHLWFRADPDGKGSVWDRGAGLSFDATTRPDFTAYTTIGSATDLKGLLSLEAARLRDPLAGVTTEALVAEKRIIQDELLYRGEHGARQALSLLDDQMFPEGHPYRGNIAVGADVEKLQMPQLKSYAERVYIPAATTLSVESDTDTETLRGAFEEVFGDLLAGPGTACEHPRAEPDPPMPPGAGTITTIEAPVRAQRLYMAWSMPAAFNGDAFIDRLAGRQLENAIWSRLPWVSGLKGDMSDVDAGCRYTPGLQASRLTCVVQLPNNIDAAEVAKAALNSLASQWSISQGDTYERNRLTASIQSSTLDRTLALADQMSSEAVEGRAMYRHVAGGQDPLAMQLAATLELNPNQLAAIAQAYLTPQRAVILLMKPVPFDGELLRNTTIEPRLSAPTLPEWTPARPTLKVKTQSFDNGLTVLSSYRGMAPVTRAALVRDGGSLAGPVGIDVAWNFSKVYDVPGVSLSEMRRKTGASSWDSTGWDTSAIHARAGGGSADLAMWATRVWLDTTSVDTSGLGDLDRIIGALERELTTWPSQLTYTLRAEHLMGDHPTAIPWWDEYAAARTIREGELLKWRKSQDNPAHATLILVSPDPENATAAAQKYVSKWKGKKVEPLPAPTEPAWPKGQKIMALNWDSLMADIRLSCRLPARTVGNDAAQDVLNSIVQRGAYQTLREDGGTYAPSVGLSTPHRGVAMLGMHAEVPPNQAGATTAAMLGLLDAASSPSKNLVEWGKLEALGSHARRHASTLDHFAALESAISKGMTVAEENSYPDRVDAVTAEAVAALLAPCVGNEAVTVVGPTPSESLQKAGLASTPVNWQSEGKKRAKAVR